MTSTPDPDSPIAVVGAGFSGTMTALHLLAKTDRRPILLCERAERFARGTAYGTDDPGHLLNVRASNMSAFPDRPDHFVRWLEGQGHESAQVHHTAAGTFVSRHLYGCYLTSLLEEAVSNREGAARLILVPDEVVDLLPEDGGGFRLALAGGRQPQVAAAVMAVGNLLAAPSEAGPYVANPWASPFTEDLEPGEPVVVLGTGLTMVDVTVQLRHAGFRGPIVAVSRHGLLPHTHVATAPWPTPRLSAAERTSPARLLRRLRREAAAAAACDVPWQNIVDSVRPITAGVWLGFDRAAQARFLRHGRAFWDSHRHRMAVPVGADIAALLRGGTLSVTAGHVLDVAAERGQARVTYRPRGSAGTATLQAQRVINAMGPIGPDRCEDVLLRSLMDRGLVVPDGLRLGLDVTTGCETIGRDGRTVSGLWAVGPLARGVFWECVAVPDIRDQAAQVARRVAASLL